jgi:hypothetical protein
MPLTVSNFLLGPLIALAVVGVLAAVLRYILGREVSLPDPTPADPDDFGLLCAAAVTADPDTAAAVRERLQSAGIRATLATGGDGLIRVLVFERELDEARRVVG